MDSFKSKLEKFIYKINNREDLDNNMDLYGQIEKDITLEHAKISKNIINKNKKINIDLVGFHGQTILHKPSDGYSIQAGDPNLLSNILKKDIYFDFRSLDIKNGGEGAPVASIYHKLIYNKMNFDNEVIFLNIGGISNLTYVNQTDSLISFDTGPGNCIIDNWIKNNLTNKKNIRLIGFGGNINKIYKIAGTRIGKPLSTKKLNSIIRKLEKMSDKEKLLNYRLNPDKLDIIIPASKVYKFLIDKLNLSQIEVPKIGLSDGMISELINKSKT